MRYNLLVKLVCVWGALTLSPITQATIYSTTYSYDVPNGRVTRTDPDGKRIRYQYNAVDRLNEVRLLGASGQSTFTYEYDATDQLTCQTYRVEICITVLTIPDLQKL